MSTKTTNLELTKPAYGESADIAVINANMDTLDTAVAGKVTAPSGTVTANTAVVFDGTTGKAVKSSGKTLGTACSKNYTTEVTSGSANLVTSGGVYSAIRDLLSTWTLISNFSSFYDTTKTITLTQAYTDFPYIYIKANGANMESHIRIKTEFISTSTMVGSRQLTKSSDTREAGVKAIAGSTTQLSVYSYGCSVIAIYGAWC